jgi:hypothetical protein
LLLFETIGINNGASLLLFQTLGINNGAWLLFQTLGIITRQHQVGSLLIRDFHLNPNKQSSELNKDPRTARPLCSSDISTPRLTKQTI